MTLLDWRFDSTAIHPCWRVWAGRFQLVAYEDGRWEIRTYAVDSVASGKCASFERAQHIAQRVAEELLRGA